MVVQAATFLSTVILAGLLSGECRFDNPYLALGPLCGILGMIGALSTLFSMGRGEVGTNIAVVRLSFMPTTIGAILFLGEPLTLRKGFLVLFAATAVLLFVDHYRKENRAALGSLVPALTACFAFGAFDIVYKVASGHGVDPLAFLMVQSVTGNIVVNLFARLREGGYSFNRVTFRLAPVCGFLFAAACLSWLKALRDVDVSLVVPFVQMNFILTYLLGVIFLKESITKRKAFGITMVLMAILMLSENALQHLTGWMNLFE